MQQELNAAVLRDCLTYSPGTGEFIWKRTVSKKMKKGALAGSRKGYPYKRIRINGVAYLSHRLAWMYMYGALPLGALDHVNRCKTDNRIENLRVVTNSENSQNQGLSKKNASGYRGVFWRKDRSYWVARIKKNRKTTNLGRFSAKEEAAKAYSLAASILHTINPYARGAE